MGIGGRLIDQRKRSLLNIFFLIVSIGLITATATIIVSLRGSLINQSIRDEGAYHGIIMGIDRDRVTMLKNHIDVKDVGLITFNGSAPIVETTEEEREDYGENLSHRYIEVYSFDEKSMDLLPIKVKEGRLPVSSDEIIIEYWMLDYIDGDVELGDKINLSLGEENSYEKEYKLVGLIQPSFVWKGDLITQGISGLDSKSIIDKYNVVFTLKDIEGARKKIASIVDDLGVDEENYITNYKLLKLSEEHENQLFNKSVIALLIFGATIIIATMTFLHKFFKISLLERKSQLTQLRTNETDTRQIKGILLREAAYLCSIGIPTGLFFGLQGVRLVRYATTLLQPDIYLFRDMDIKISIPVLILSSLSGLIIVFLPALGPIRRAGKVSDSLKKHKKRYNISHD